MTEKYTILEFILDKDIVEIDVVSDMFANDIENYINERDVINKVHAIKNPIHARWMREMKRLDREEKNDEMKELASHQPKFHPITSDDVETYLMKKKIIRPITPQRVRIDLRQ